MARKPLDALREARTRMKQEIAKRNGKEWIDANPPANFQPEQAERASPQAKGSGQAEAQGAEHGQQGVADDPAAGAGEGRVQVPSVSKAGGRARGARGSQG